MRILRFYFCLITLLNYCNVKKDDVVVIGIAMHEKNNAVVITKDDKMYFIDSLNRWDERIYSKMIKVSGKLLIEEFKKKSVKLGEITPQQFVGIKRTILKPKWELVK